MKFRDRIDAAGRLAKALSAYKGKNVLILAIPRGAVPMGKVLAEALGGELDVVLVKKLRSPQSAEFAVGAIDETGWAYVADYAAGAGATAAYLEREKAAQMETLRKRRSQYSPMRPAIDPAGRIAIVVDDGLATGATMIAALHAVRAKKPAKLVCAVPVASEESLAKVSPYADQVVCLETPFDFFAVGQFYDYFPQVEDEEVAALLGAAQQEPEGAKT